MQNVKPPPIGLLVKLQLKDWGLQSMMTAQSARTNSLDSRFNTSQCKSSIVISCGLKRLVLIGAMQSTFIQNMNFLKVAVALQVFGRLNA